MISSVCHVAAEVAYISSYCSYCGCLLSHSLPLFNSLPLPPSPYHCSFVPFAALSRFSFSALNMIKYFVMRLRLRDVDIVLLVAPAEQPPQTDRPRERQVNGQVNRQSGRQVGSQDARLIDSAVFATLLPLPLRLCSCVVLRQNATNCQPSHVCCCCCCCSVGWKILIKF